MINRPFSTVLARLGLVAAILATLMILAPVVSAADAEYNYAEDRTDLEVATFSASDPDADADDPEWDLSGPDADDFEISDDGVLSFKKQPNYESPTDRDDDNDEDTAVSGDQGAGDNVYKVTVEALGGDLDVAVTVTNVNEAGSVSFSRLQAQETRSLVASYKDDDAPLGNSTWQWSRGSSAAGPFEPIDGATSSDRTPNADDLGNWLRATVSYTDSYGAQTASNEIGPVVGETLANAAPSFSGQDEDDDTAGAQVTRSVNENAKGNLGEPITATDADGDPRKYSLGGADKDCFGIGETSGQLSLSAERNFEDTDDPCKEGGTARAAEDNTYEVTVIATDPSGASGQAMVVVTVTDVNEEPKFVDPSGTENQKTLYIDENAASPALRTTMAAPASPQTITYDADDNDGTTKDTETTYKVEGADAKYFAIASSGGDGTLTAVAQGDVDDDADKKILTADYEDKSSYSIVIVAETNVTDPPATDDTRDDDADKFGRQAVTIKVVDGEDTGTVKFPFVREPQAGKSVLSQLDDKDGGETGVKWQWYRYISGTPVNVDATTALTCPDNGRPSFGWRDCEHK